MPMGHFDPNWAHPPWPHPGEGLLSSMMPGVPMVRSPGHTDLPIGVASPQGMGNLVIKRCLGRAWAGLAELAMTKGPAATAPLQSDIAGALWLNGANGRVCSHHGPSHWDHRARKGWEGGERFGPWLGRGWGGPKAGPAWPWPKAAPLDGALAVALWPNGSNGRVCSHYGPPHSGQ